jgi:hypothetical protein
VKPLVIKLLRVFAAVWLTLGIFVIIASRVAIALKQGFGVMLETTSPFNVINFLVIVVLLGPGLLALGLAKKLEQNA